MDMWKQLGGRGSTPQRCFECFASSGVQSTAILHIKGRNELVLFALQQSRNDAHADIFIYCNEKQLFNFYPFPYWLSVKRIVTGLCRWLLTRLNRMMKQKKKRNQERALGISSGFVNEACAPLPQKSPDDIGWGRFGTFPFSLSHHKSTRIFFCIAFNRPLFYFIFFIRHCLIARTADSTRSSKLHDRRDSRTISIADGNLYVYMIHFIFIYFSKPSA